MDDAEKLVIAGVSAAVLAFAITPVARWVAVRTGFLDHPVAYKAHRAPTPYLGGFAVIIAFLAAGAITGELFGPWSAMTACVLLLLVVGTLDDRVSLPIAVRFAVQAAAAVTLWGADLGWAVFGSEAANLAITLLWVVGLVNAFNLLDNQDGATASVAGSCGVGIAALSQIHGDTAVAVLGLALAGACLGFLPHNLARPARIFLGDGGSMPIGLIVATLIMSAPLGSAQWSDLLIAAPLAGIPILDTSLVVFSRSRRRVAVLSGARDHLAHRLLAPLRTPARVAAVLAGAQLALAALVLGLAELEPLEVALISTIYLAAGAGLILVLDSPRWLPGAVAERAEVAEELAA